MKEKIKVRASIALSVHHFFSKLHLFRKVGL